MGIWSDQSESAMTKVKSLLQGDCAVQQHYLLATKANANLSFVLVQWHVTAGK